MIQVERSVSWGAGDNTLFLHATSYTHAHGLGFNGFAREMAKFFFR